MIFDTKLDSKGVVNGVKALGSTLGNVAASGLKIFTAGVSAAATGVSALGTIAVKSYADYEQLVGGIETLFGAGGATTVQEYAKNVGKSVDEVRDEFDMLMEAQSLAMANANNAYASAGLSANEYMETVTSFAASLKASTANEVEAAEAANQAVIDMSDNANKMGTSMESIQNAYQGFAKQNYTMLDNLKLGYGGTKEEMQRLLTDAEKLSGIKYDISSLSDVYSAIHVIQDELGITGTTALEASTTISGSLNAMKASWSNLLVGMADDTQDFDTLVNNFVKSAATFAGNVMPRVITVIGGIGQLIESLLPVIINEIPAIINEVLPDLLQSGINMITALLDGMQQNLPQIAQGAVKIMSMLVDSFVALLPQMLEMGLQIIIELALGMSEALPELAVFITEVVIQIVTVLLNHIPDIIQAGIQLLLAIVQAIPQVITALASALPQIVQSIITALIEGIPLLIDGAIQFLMAIVDAIPQILDSLIAALPQIITTIIDGLIAGIPLLIEGAIQLFLAIIDAIPEINRALREALPQIIAAIIEGLAPLGEQLLELFSEAFSNLCMWISEIWISIKEYFMDGWNNIVAFFTEGIPTFIENVSAWISELPEKFMYWLGFTLTSIALWGADLIDWVTVNIPIFVENIVTFISELPGKIARFLGEVLGSVIAWGNNMRLKAIETGTKFVDNVVNFIKTLPSRIAGFLGEVIGSVVGFVSNMKTKATEAGRGFFDNIVSALADLPNKMGEIGGQIVGGIMAGISNGWGRLVNYVKDLANSLFQGAKDALDIHSPSRKFKWLAEMCVAGFDEGMDGLMNTDAMTRNINASMSTVQANINGTRTGGSIGGFGNFNQTINVHQQISTPDELARAVRVESRYGLMRGVAFG